MGFKSPQYEKVRRKNEQKVILKKVNRKQLDRGNVPQLIIFLAHQGGLDHSTANNLNQAWLTQVISAKHRG